MGADGPGPGRETNRGPRVPRPARGAAGREAGPRHAARSGAPSQESRRSAPNGAPRGTQAGGGAVARAVISGLVLLVILFGLMELLLPVAVERTVETALQTRLGTAVDVELKANPAVKLLLGRIDRLTAEAKNVAAGELIIDELATTMEAVALNFQALLGDPGTEIIRAGRARLTVRVSAERLTAFVMEAVPRVERPVITLDAEGARVRAVLVLNRRHVPVSALGTFRPAEGGRRIVFALEAIALDGVALPEALMPVVLDLLGGPELFLDLDRLPLAAVATEVRTEPGWLVIEAETAPR